MKTHDPGSTPGFFRKVGSMNVFAWLKLLFLEQKLYHGAFGKYYRYCRWCLERDAKTIAERVAVADEVLRGPGVNVMEAQANELYCKARTR